MSLLAYDGFDNYASWANMVARASPFTWHQGTLAPTIGTSNPRFTGSQYLDIGISSGAGAIFVNTDATVITGFAVDFSAVSGSVDITFEDAISVAVHVTVRFNILNGMVSVYRGTASGTLLGNTAVNAFSDVGWQFLEAKALIDNSSGAVTVKMNGATLLNITGVDTQNSSLAYATEVKIASAVTNSVFGTAHVDDFYICNGVTDSGTYPFDDFIGDVRVYTLLPASDNSVQWTPLSGSSNYAMVDDPTFDGDTTYNYSSTPGDVDLFTCSGIPTGITRILAVQLTGAYRKDDAGAHTLSQQLKSGSTQVAGTVTALGTNYSFLGDIFTADPNTGIGWTNSAVNNMTVGYKLES